MPTNKPEGIRFDEYGAIKASHEVFALLTDGKHVADVAGGINVQCGPVNPFCQPTRPGINPICGSNPDCGGIGDVNVPCQLNLPC